MSGSEFLYVPEKVLICHLYAGCFVTEQWQLPLSYRKLSALTWLYYMMQSAKSVFRLSIVMLVKDW